MSVGIQALVTLEEAKAFVRATDDKDITVLEGIIDGVSELFAAATERTLVSTVYTSVYFDGNGEREFWLPNYPVTLITSIYEDDVALTENTDYYAYLTEGLLVRIGGAWRRGRKTIKATLTAGYVLTGTGANLPKDLRGACLKQIAADWKKFQHNSWGEISRSVGQQSVSISEKGILSEVEQVLTRYKRLGI